MVRKLFAKQSVVEQSVSEFKSQSRRSIIRVVSLTIAMKSKDNVSVKYLEEQVQQDTTILADQNSDYTKCLEVVEILLIHYTYYDLMNINVEMFVSRDMKLINNVRFHICVDKHFDL